MNESRVDVEAPATRLPAPARNAVGVALAALVAAALNAVVAVIAQAAGASDDFRPLEPGTFVPLTAIGVLVASVGWALVRRSRHAASTLRWLVPAVLVITWVPDLILGASASQPGTTWTGVIGLMAMHVVVAVVVVAMLQRMLPVRDR